MAEDSLLKIKGARVNHEYIANQVEVARGAQYWKDHKTGISKFDAIYRGFLDGLTPDGESTLPAEEPMVENKLKNSSHDIKRLAKEARGYYVFTKEGEDDDAALRAKIRAVISETIWEEGGGVNIEGSFYFDLIRGGFAAAAVYVDKEECPYPLFLRLDPMYGYPTVVNGKLVDYLHVEVMKENQAAALFKVDGLSSNPSKNGDVEVVLYFDKKVALQAVVQQHQDGKRVATIVSEWKHNLGRVPVGFKQLETADGRFAGLLDQLAGPLKARNKATKLMVDYLEDMVHAPYEERGVKNASTPPGPTVVYHHDEDAEGNTFIRRVAPAAPAAAVFGLLNYMDLQEQTEGFQPPSRVGNVRQSIASGSFVESTQGGLSSVVLELQDYVSKLRKELNIRALMIDEKFLDKKKPLIRAVGQKQTYKPKSDIKGWYFHKVAFGAAAGMDRQMADSRVLQHLGAGLIDDQIARDQIDYIEGDANIQDDVDRMLLRKVQWQKLINDPQVPFSALARIELLMGKGKTRRQALEEVLPDIMKHEEQVQAQAASGGGAPPVGPEAPVGAEGMPAEEEAMMLQKGATPGAEELEVQEFSPPPFLQISG